MKTFAPRKILGLAIGPKSILVAEVADKGGRRASNVLAEFTYPNGVSLANSTELGQALRSFLRQAKVSTHDAVIGLPAKWLVTRRKDVPPAAAAMAASTLRLQAEGEFANEPEGMVFDYAGRSSASQATSVLLIATVKNYVDQAAAMAEAAGLRLRAVTATAAALGRITCQDGSSHAVVVSLAPGYAELVLQHGDQPSQLRHVTLTGTPAETPAALAGEIRRVLAGASTNGSPLKLTLWEGAGTDGAHDGESGGPGNLLATRLGIPVNAPALGTMVSSGQGGGAGAGRGLFAPAVAVALTGLDPAGPPVDFLHSRLAPPKVATNRRRVTWALAAAAVVLGLVGYAVTDLNSRGAELESLRAGMKTRASEVKVAQAEQDRLDFVRSWSPANPRALACLRDITALFPDRGTIYATSLSFEAVPVSAAGTNLAALPPAAAAAKPLHLKYIGTLTGIASSRKEATDLYDVMRKDTKAFAELKTGPMSEKGRNGNEVTFSFSFVYRATE